MRRWALSAAVIAVLAGIALVFRTRDRLPDTPEETVSTLMDAASRGDDALYLRLTSGGLRTSLEATRSQLGSQAFRESLRRTVLGMTGVGVSRRPEAPAGQAVLEVDLVFADRIERQHMTLADQGNGWTIQAISSADMVKPPVAYGTPVFTEAPPEVSGASGTPDKAKPDKANQGKAMEERP